MVLKTVMELGEEVRAPPSPLLCSRLLLTSRWGDQPEGVDDGPLPSWLHAPPVLATAKSARIKNLLRDLRGCMHPP